MLFADGDETYDLIVLLAGEAQIIERRGQPGETVIATYGRSQFLGEISLLTGQRVYLSAVASTAGAGAARSRWTRSGWSWPRNSTSAS